jgi:DNA-binding GntR family transcriptional regulator
MKLDTYKSNPLSEKVFQVLKDRIVSGKYPPKTVLVEKEICKEFGVSRTPYREAITKLKELNIVEVMSRFGTYVSEINMHEVRDAYEIRSTLDPLAARLAAERRDPEQLNNFKRLLECGESEIKNEESIILRNNLDKNCHEIIAKATHNAILATELERLIAICARIWTSGFRENISNQEIVIQWERIYSAVEDGNSDLAGAIMTEHMNYTIEKLRKGFF